MDQADRVLSTPPINASPANVIQLSAFVRTARDKRSGAEVTAIGNRTFTPRQRRREGEPALPPPASETARNLQIRIARRDAWWRADRASAYWRARLDWHGALRTAQKWGIADSASFPQVQPTDRFGLVDKWRAAVAKKLLIPAPDAAAVNWKRAQLKSRDFCFLPVKKDRVERAIADDVAFLTAHPTRMRKGEQYG